MATYNILKATGTELPAATASPIVPLYAHLKPGEINAGAGMAQNDVVQCIHIPASTYVFSVNLQVLAGQSPDELSANQSDVNVGDGATTNGWLDAQDCTSAVNATGGIGSGTLTLTEAAPNTVAGYQMGKLYAAADTIDVENATAATGVTGLLRLTAMAMHFGLAPIPVVGTNGL
jgi:predicted secreted protein